MKLRNKIMKSENRWLPYTVATCSAVILYMILNNLNVFGKGISTFFSIISPVIYGLIIAYVMDPLVDFFQTKVFKHVKKPSHNRLYAVIAATVTVIVVIAILLVALIPQVVDSVVSFITNFTSYAKSLQKILNSLTGSKIDISQITKAGSEALDYVSKWLGHNSKNIIKTSFQIGTNIFNFVISCFIALYFLLDARRLQNNLRTIFKGFMSPSTYHKATSFWRRCNRILIRYIVFDLLDGCIIGVCNFVFFLIMGLPYAILVSVVVAVTNLAPTFGPLVGGVIGSCILVLVNPWYALWFIIFTIALQTMDGYFIKPKLFGDSLGVPSLWVLTFIIVGGRMFGVWGVLLSIPCAAIVNFIYEEIILVRLGRRASKKFPEVKVETEETKN
jgi:predicted PurR-regulated permease PerM